MKRAADFRLEAREALKLNGQYWPFVGAYALLMVIIGIATIPSMFLLGIPFFYLIGFVAWPIAMMALAVMRGESKFSMWSSGWGHGWKTFWVILVQGTYVQLWLLLLIIPGIIKAFSYAMTLFVYVEHPDWTANQCITESRRLMDGNKWRYFCLNISFIGWILLIGIISIVPGGALAELVFLPYVTTAQAAFYEEIKREKGPAISE